MGGLRSWVPERFFYSHASGDRQLTAVVEAALGSRKDRVDLYVAEHGLVGRPLVEKLRSELLGSNALLVGWTRTAAMESSSIISFELGMAFSLGLPIYLLRVDGADLPWFFDKLTDYVDVREPTQERVAVALEKIEPFSYYHPIEVEFPRSARKQSRNPEVVAEDGGLALPRGFDGIVHFIVENRRQRPERDVRLSLAFPPLVAVTFNAGTRDGTSGVQRNEMFEMWQAPMGVVRIWWPSMPAEDGIAFEVRLRVGKDGPVGEERIDCSLSSENVVGWKSKSLPLRVV
jgi:hypothetical protein